jgi:hypothetical protein
LSTYNVLISPNPPLAHAGIAFLKARSRPSPHYPTTHAKPRPGAQAVQYCTHPKIIWVALIRAKGTKVRGISDEREQSCTLRPGQLGVRSQTRGRPGEPRCLVTMARFCLLRARPRCGLPLSSPVKPAPAWSCLNAGIHHTRNPVLWCSAGRSADNTRGRRGASETKVSGSMRTVLVMVEARPFWSVAATHVLAAAEGWERRSGRGSSGFHVLGLRRQCDCGCRRSCFRPQ